MNYTLDPEHASGYVSIADGEEHSVVKLDSDAFASLDAAGALIGLELLDTPRFGDPFDDAAAERAVAWARTKLELDPAS